MSLSCIRYFSCCSSSISGVAIMPQHGDIASFGSSRLHCPVSKKKRAPLAAAAVAARASAPPASTG